MDRQDDAEAGRRRSLRRPLHAEVEVLGPEGTGGMVVNASTGGLAVGVARPLPIDAEVTVRIELAGGASSTVRARVAWCRPHGNGHLVGLDVIEDADSATDVPDELPITVEIDVDEAEDEILQEAMMAVVDPIADDLDDPEEDLDPPTIPDTPASDEPPPVHTLVLHESELPKPAKIAGTHRPPIDTLRLHRDDLPRVPVDTLELHRDELPDSGSGSGWVRVAPDKDDTDIDDSTG